LTIAHIADMKAAQGFPISGSGYGNINDIDFYDDQSYDLELDMDLKVRESRSRKRFDSCVSLSSSSDNSPESVVL
jgi:hypothetical protein